MIQITDKQNCCGCSACAQRCPKQCITMQEDEEGFLYPKVDEALCINCGKCEKVCPYLQEDKKGSVEPKGVMTAINQNVDVREQSSSGGIFTMLAERTLKEGGVIFGARFDDQWNVVHDYTETVEGLEAFRGSKYVQSVIGNAYRDAEGLLKAGRKVLFTGTPCQIRGLQMFLRKTYDNLLTVAIACHSIPSSKLWQDYLVGMKLQEISDINFRDKQVCWERYGLKVSYVGEKTFFQEHEDNVFMQLFLHGLTARPSCFNCPAKDGKSKADLVIGDCWNVAALAPSLANDHRGISFVVCQTEKGKNVLEALNIPTTDISYDLLTKNNGGLTQTAKEPASREPFWQEYNKSSNKLKTMKKYARPYLPSLVLRLKRALRSVIK